MVNRNVLVDNIATGVLLQNCTNSFVTENDISGDSYWAIAIWDSSNGNEVAGNLIEVSHDAVSIEGLDGNPLSATGNRVLDNTIAGATGGILLAVDTDNLVKGNDISNVTTALLIGEHGCPIRFFGIIFTTGVTGASGQIRDRLRFMIQQFMTTGGDIHTPDRFSY